MKTSNAVVLVFALAVLAGLGGIYWFYFGNKPAGNNMDQSQPPQVENNQETMAPSDASSTAVTATDETTKPAGEEPAAPEEKATEVVGKSAAGREIMAYHFGTGSKEILLAGGIHGGYSWNTALLAYKMIDNFKADAAAIPANIKITIVPVLNPDGLSKVAADDQGFDAAQVSTSKDLQTAGRFNGNNVDLNRNFDCNWKAQGVWQNKPVSGGASAFSEPESKVVRDYAQGHKIVGVIAWYASGGGVYAASCGNGVLSETQAIVDLYAKASGYAAHKNFESYQVSGDMTDWFAKNNVPAIGVLLKSATDAEWNQNWAGVKAVIDHYAK